MLPDLAGPAGKEIYMKEALKQVVDLLHAPARIPNEIKHFKCLNRLKKWLAVLAQYKFVCKHHAIAHIEEKSNRGYLPRARVESLPDEVPQHDTLPCRPPSEWRTSPKKF